MTPEDSKFIDILDERTQSLWKNYKKSIESEAAIKADYIALYETTTFALKELGFSIERFEKMHGEIRERYYLKLMIAVEDVDPAIAAEIVRKTEPPVD